MAKSNANKHIYIYLYIRVKHYNFLQLKNQTWSKISRFSGSSRIILSHFVIKCNLRPSASPPGFPWGTLVEGWRWRRCPAHVRCQGPALGSIARAIHPRVAQAAVAVVARPGRRRPRVGPRRRGRAAGPPGRRRGGAVAARHVALTEQVGLEKFECDSHD